MAFYDPIKTILHDNKPYLENKYHVSKIGIFGSYARGDADLGSDIDILVELSRPIGLEFVSLAEELEALLKHRVDLVTSNAIKPKMMKHIKKDIIYV